MDKINQNSSKKPNRTPTRFIILPVKKHLAKFLLFSDWKTIKHPDPITNIYFLNYLKTFNSEYKWTLKYFLNENLKNENPIASVKYYRNRKNLSPLLESYIKKDYTLLKIELKISSSKFIQGKKMSFTEKVNLTNNSIKYFFQELVAFYMFQHPNKKQAIDELYFYFNLTESDLKKETLRRWYYRKEKSLPKMSQYLSSEVSAIQDFIKNPEY
jgi:hypothetical protein